jgi:hypothetical protein
VHTQRPWPNDYAFAGDPDLCGSARAPTDGPVTAFIDLLIHERLERIG